LATTQRESELLRCNFQQRLDDFKECINLKKESDKCGFDKARQSRIETILRSAAHDQLNTPLANALVTFLAKSNISTNAVCTGDLHRLLIQAFESEWDTYLSAPKDVSKDVAAHRAIPPLQVPQLRNGFRKKYQETRRELIEIFTNYKYVNVSLDGVTVKCRQFLNLDVLHPPSDTLPFTFSFLDHTTMSKTVFVNALAEQLTMMASDGLIAGGVISDRCRFQVAALR
jgi:hypothetical protein